MPPRRSRRRRRAAGRAAAATPAGDCRRAVHPRAHRRARRGHQHCAAARSARRPAEVSEGEGRGRAGAPGEPGRPRRCTCCRPVSPARAGPAPSHLTPFTSERLRLPAGQRSELRVPLTWTDDQGVTVTKTFIFHRGAYRIERGVRGARIAARALDRRPLRADPAQRPAHQALDLQRRQLRLHGPAIYDGTKYRKLDHDRPRRQPPVAGSARTAGSPRCSTTSSAPSCRRRMRLPLHAERLRRPVPARRRRSAAHRRAGATAQFTQTLFVGPKLQRSSTRPTPSSPASPTTAT